MKQESLSFLTTRYTAPAAPFAKQSDTSIAAAEAIVPHAAAQRGLVLSALREVGALGLTDEQIGDATGLDGNSVRPRRGELVKRGLVVDSDYTRETRSGRKATVWIVKL